MEYGYIVDEKDVIVEIDDNWKKFAQENWDGQFQRQWVLGKPLWDFISDETTKHIYRTLMERIRRDKKKSFDLPFRCDSDETVREMSMRIEPLKEGKIRFRSTLVKRTPREDIHFYAQENRDKSKFVRMCSWCKKIYDHENEKWVELEEMLDRWKPMKHAQLPMISHGICEGCLNDLKNI